MNDGAAYGSGMVMIVRVAAMLWNERHACGTVGFECPAGSCESRATPGPFAVRSTAGAADRGPDSGGSEDD
ncbi:hypothetical protein [Aureimonas leprariae]|uniref:hypothetical protein n=1 Tax=Plantimonas leprariae TaxID=2615207 RepID=UPI001AEDB2AF|nr:hypothetical protein [Aureimonas leprariae]